MAVHRRRITPAAAIRIALILAANVAAGWFLWGLAHKPAQAARPDTAGASEPASRAGLSTPAALEKLGGGEAAANSGHARLDSIGSRIRSIVEQGRSEASRLSKGHVSAGEVHVAVHLRDPSSGAEFGIDSARAMRPASNMKIATTVAALTLLGPDWEFVTPIEARGTLEAGRLEGDLVLRASGDPLFDADGEGSVERLLAPALDELERSGLRTVSGNLVLDEGSFDNPAPPAGWPGASQRYQEFCALSGGFSANRGCLTIRVAPTSIGSAAEVAVQPAGFGLERQFSAATVASGKLSIGFDARRTGLIVRGNIPRSSPPFVGSCPVPDPVELFASVLRHELKARGISIAGATLRERNTPRGNLLARIRTPLSSYLVPINQESNNAVADQLYLATANTFLSNASRSGAEAASLAALERLHVTGDGFRQIDGSGLSDLNRVSARQLTALIQAVVCGEPRTARIYRSSLAVGGVSGTLDGRMRGAKVKGRVSAKTGFIGGTSALSGIVKTRDEGELVFSILVNYDEFGGLNSSVWKPMEDEICELLAGCEL
ncbi:MAG TPA: D-alanyl-D-alanine carboxypeptidase/D-alanyl-D-alanine-endopeptidase [Planctomycetota bacterium]|nr:D-alanyl-D-alanine carboxypeptidase/D-alanyl-D-alanine-endopeptidase [Planctomycetota bacterium]